MLRKLATTAACALALAIASPAVAYADSLSLADQRGDVWAMDTPEQGQHTRVPGRRQGDIVRTVFDHRQNQFVIRTKFVQLNHTGRLVLVATKLRTNAGLVREVSLLASPRKGTRRWRGVTDVTGRNGRPADCAASHSIDYSRNVATVRVPRSCLGNPRSVRASHGVAALEGGAVFTDNPKNGRATVNLPPFTAPIRHTS